MRKPKNQRRASRAEGGRVKAVVRKILKGIAGYETEQREILNAIQRHGGRLTQNDFDKEFSDFTESTSKDGITVRRMKPIELRFFLASDDAFILGSMQQPGNWAKYLHLTQLMAQAGLVRIEGESPNIVYIANMKAEAPK